VRVSLRRPIDKDKHVREIDGLRLLAVATVVASHIAPSVARHYEDSRAGGPVAIRRRSRPVE
jgi:peptidoglycan/LPS O-acetylase OafA/YrhL